MGFKRRAFNMQTFDDSIFEEVLGKKAPSYDDFDKDDPQAVQNALKENLPQVLKELSRLAENGDMSAIREYNRILLPKDGAQAYIKFDMPEDLDNISIDDVGRILKSILSAVGKGELSIQQAGELSKIVESLTHSLEIKELGMRLKDLESMIMQRLPSPKRGRNLKLIPLNKIKDGTYG
jgi:hypothetical protein